MNGMVIKQMVPETFDGSGGGAPIFSIKTYGEGVSNFYIFFHPFFEHLGDYKWCRMIGDNFDLPSDWYDDEDEEKDGPRLSEIEDSNLMRMPPKGTKPNGLDYECCEFAAVLELSYVQKFSKYFRGDHDLIFLVKKTLGEETCGKILQYLCFRNADREIESIL